MFYTYVKKIYVSWIYHSSTEDFLWSESPLVPSLPLLPSNRAAHGPDKNLLTCVMLAVEFKLNTFILKVWASDILVSSMNEFRDRGFARWSLRSSWIVHDGEGGGARIGTQLVPMYSSRSTVIGLCCIHPSVYHRMSLRCYFLSLLLSDYHSFMLLFLWRSAALRGCTLELPESSLYSDRPLAFSVLFKYRRFEGRSLSGHCLIFHSFTLEHVLTGSSSGLVCIWDKMSFSPCWRYHTHVNISGKHSVGPFTQHNKHTHTQNHEQTTDDLVTTMNETRIFPPLSFPASVTVTVMFNTVNMYLKMRNLFL